MQLTVLELDPTGGPMAEQFAVVISEVFHAAMPEASVVEHPTLLEALQTGILRQLTVLDDASLTGTGQSSADVLGVSGNALAATLAAHLVRTIIHRGSSGGPLSPLADQLNHDVTHMQNQQLQGMLVQLTDEVHDALVRTGIAGDRDFHLGGKYTVAANKALSNFTPLSVSEYRTQLKPLIDFYQDIFVGRVAEWIELVRFAADRKGGYLLVTAPPGYGKSALAAEVIERYAEVQRTKDQVTPDILYFFIREGINQNLVPNFLAAMVSQLITILNASEQVALDSTSLNSQFIRLWAEAVERAANSRPLLLIVDGLDEVADDSSDIVTQLPANIGSYVHVIVTSRPNPEPRTKVPPEHPLRRASVWELGPLGLDEIKELLIQQGIATAAPGLAQRVLDLTHGHPLLARFMTEDLARHGETVLDEVDAIRPQGAEQYFSWQLQQLDMRINKDAQIGSAVRNVLGILLTAHGPISQADISELLSISSPEVRKAIIPIERFLIGSKDRMELMHQELRRRLEQSYFTTSEVASYANTLCRWCLKYEAANWPPTTPQYVVDHCASHLSATDRLDALFRLVSNSWRKLRYSRSHSYRGFINDTQITFRRLAQLNVNSIPDMIKCSLVLCTTVNVTTSMPLSLIVGLVLLDEPERAVDHILLQNSVDQRVRSFYQCASMLLRRGYDQQARQFIAWGDSELQNLSVLHVKAEILAKIASIIHDEMPAYAEQLAQEALNTGRSVQDSKQRVQTLDIIASYLQDPFPSLFVAIVESIVDQSVELSRNQIDPGELSHAGSKAIEAGSYIAAEKVARRLTELGEQAHGWESEHILSLAAQAYFEHGNIERGIEILGKIPAQSFWRDSATVYAVRAYVRAGQITMALTTAESICEESHEGSAAVSIAGAYARNDDYDLALQVLENISDVSWSMRGFGWIIKMLSEKDAVNRVRNVVELAMSTFLSSENELAQELSLRNFIDLVSGTSNETLSAVAAGLRNAIESAVNTLSLRTMLAVALSEILARQSHFQDAVAVADKISSPDDKDSAVENIISQCLKQRVPDASLAVAALGDIQDTHLRAIWSGEVALHLMGQGFAEKAERLVKDGISANYVPAAWGNNYRAEVFSKMALELNILDQRPLAIRAARHALSCVQGLNMDRSRAGTLAIAAASLSTVGMTDEANNAANEAFAIVTSMIRDPQLAVLTAAEVVDGLANTNERFIRVVADFASTLALAMPRTDIGKSNALAYAASTLARANEFDRAFTMASDELLGSDRARALSMVATSMLRIQKPHEAMTAVDGALADSDADTAKVVDLETLANIADVLVECGHESRARRVIMTRLSVVNSSRGYHLEKLLPAVAKAVGSGTSVNHPSASNIAEMAFFAARNASEHREHSIIWAAVAFYRAGETAQARSAAIDAVKALHGIRGDFGKVWAFVEVASAIGLVPELANSSALYDEVLDLIRKDDDIYFDFPSRGEIHDNVDVCALIGRAAAVIASRSDRTTFFFMVKLMLENPYLFGTQEDLIRMSTNLIDAEMWLTVQS